MLRGLRWRKFDKWVGFLVIAGVGLRLIGWWYLRDKVGVYEGLVKRGEGVVCLYGGDCFLPIGKVLMQSLEIKSLRLVSIFWWITGLSFGWRFISRMRFDVWLKRLWVLMLSVNPYFVFVSIILSPASWFVPLVLVSLYFISKVKKEGSTKDVLIVGLMLIIAGLIGWLVGGYPVHVVSFWMKRYLEYSDLDYLFFSGMRYVHDKYPGIGPMLVVGLPFFIWGLIVLLNGSVKFVDNRSRKLMLGWLLLGPLPATLANNSQHPLRSLTTLPMPQLITAIGLFVVAKVVFKKLSRNIYRWAVVGGFVGVLIINVVYFWQVYTVHFPVHYSHYLMYGMKDVATYVWQHRKEYKRVMIDPTFGVEARNITGIPFAYVLAFNQIDPVIVQKARQRPGSLRIDNIVFREVDWNKDQEMKNSLLVANKWAFPLESLENAQVVKVVRLYNGEPMFYLVRTKNK